MYLKFTETGYGRILFPAIATFVLFIVAIFSVVIPSVQSSLRDREQETIRELTRSAWTILAHYEMLERNGVLTHPQAQARSLDQIVNIRYGPDMKGYFWINDTNGVLICHPYRSDLVGTDMSNYHDPNGKFLMKAFLDTIRAHGEGYVDYLGQWNHGPDQIAPKLSFVMGFKPWGWVLGTGIYVDDLTENVASLSHRLTVISLGILLLLSAILFYLVRQGIKLERRRKQTEQALKESENLYRNLVDTMTDGLAVADVDGVMTYANARLCGMLGYSGESIVGRNLAEFLDENNQAILAGQIERRKAGHDDAYELEWKTRDGGAIATIVSPRAFHDSRGNYRGSFGVVTDITGRKRMEHMLRESEHRLKEKLDLILSPESDFPEIHLLDIIDGEDLQRFQDAFAEATDVASVIVDLDGNPLTRPSNFNPVCKIVLATDEGKRRCDHSDNVRNAKARDLSKPTFHQCLSCGFVDGSAPIVVAGKHIANWLAGQSNAKNIDRERITNFAGELGADVNAMLEAFDAVPDMPLKKFHQILDLLWIFAREISSLGYKNLLLARDVTERTTAQEALRESEERFRTAFMTSPDAISISRLEDGTFVDVNDGFASISGFAKEDVIGKTSLELGIWGDPDDRDRLAGALLENGFVSNFEAKFRYRDGRVRACLMSARIITLQGEPHMLSVTRDVEDWKQAEEALRLAEERVRTFIESVDDLVYYQGLDGETIMLNNACERVTGYSKELFENDPRFWIQVVHPDDLRIARHFWKSNRKGRPFFDLEYRMKTRSGEWKWFYSRLVGVKDASGEYVGYNCIDRDITALKAVEGELRVSREKFKDLADLLPQMVFEVDSEGRFTYLNRHGSQFTGYSHHDLRGGISIKEMITAEQWEALNSGLADGRTGERRSRVECVLKKKDASEAPVVIYSSPITQDNGVSGLRGIVIDLTETKRLQEFADRAQRLETAGRIAGQVAHDFNNLLGPMVAYPDLIADSLPEGSKISKYVKDMQRAAIQMAEINQQLLTLGRRGHYALEPVVLNDLVREAIEQNHPKPETMNFALDLVDDLMIINAGRAQILRAVTNLIINARDAMQDVGEISVRTENFYVDKPAGSLGQVPRGEYVKLTVSDSGCGIPENILPKIFDPFFTTKAAGHKHGSGLGLSIVHAVVEDHHGFIDCESRPGEGTTFYLYFPIARDTAESSDTTRIVGGSESVLVVDDDQVQRDVTRHLLEKLGYSVEEASSGSEALEKLADKEYDLLVLDMIMPNGIDGTETFRKARGLHPSQKAVIVSGFAESGRVEAAIELGAGGFVRKPLTLKSLALAVRQELDRRAAPPVKA